MTSSSESDSSELKFLSLVNFKFRIKFRTLKLKSGKFRIELQKPVSEKLKKPGKIRGSICI